MEQDILNMQQGETMTVPRSCAREALQAIAAAHARDSRKCYAYSICFGAMRITRVPAQAYSWAD